MMDATLKKVVGLLSDERLERRCAAAILLAELRAKDAEILEALGAALAEDNRLLRLYVLGALAGVRSPKIAGFVSPLLDSGDEEVSAQAAALLGSQGARGSAALAKELADAPVQRRRAIISILAHQHDAETFDRLCRLFSDPEVGEYALNALRGEIESMGETEIEALRSQLGTLLKDKKLLADAEGTGRALRLLGYLRSPRSLRTILPFCGEKHPSTVRLAALAALRRPLQAGGSLEGALDPILACAGEADGTLARAAIDTLRSVKLPEGDGLSQRLLKLSESPHAEVRKFALETVGRTGTGSSGKALKSLLAALAGDDPTARDAAAASLGRLEGAGPTLVKELETAAGAGSLEYLRLLSRLIRRHPDPLKPAAKQSIAELAADAMEQGAPAAEPLAELLAAVHAEGYAAFLAARALAHKKAKRFAEAFALFGKLGAAGLLDGETRYAALVSGLCALSSKKELGRASRTTDPVLKLIVELLAKGEPVGAKLVKEKSLEADDLFYVGFNFIESKDDDEKELGATLLSHLAETAPRSKLGRSAKNKLHLAGMD
jgi:hypothetical protein